MAQGTPGGTARPPTGTARQASKRQYRERKTGPLLSIAHAGRYLDVSRWTVYRMVESGELPPPVIVNGRKRIYQTDLDALIARRAS